MKQERVAIRYPRARRERESAYISHGRKFEDPYAWMEELDAPETVAWIGEQERLTASILGSLPGRDRLREHASRAHRYARRSAPIAVGDDRFLFLWHAEAQDEKLKFSRRSGPDGPLETLLDPNLWAKDEVLVFAVPSPDGRLVAFGTSVGNTHNAAIRLLEVATGRILPDRPRGTNHSSLAWRPDSAGFLYAGCPDPGEVPAGEAANWSAIYDHRIGSERPARRIYGDDRNKELWCAVQITECGRYAILYKWDFVHANVVHLLRLSDEAMIPVAPEMRAIHQVQLVDDVLLIVTDLDAPRGRLCRASLDEPAAWTTLIPEGQDTLQTVAGIGGRLYAVYSCAASHHVRIHDAAGRHLRDLPLPAPGSVNHNEGEGVLSGVRGSWHGDEVWLDFTSWVQPPSVYRYDYTADRLLPYHVPDIGIDPSEIVTRQVWYASPDGTQISMFLVHRKDIAADGTNFVRLGGYGGFNIPLEPRFAPVHAAWLQLGGVLAFANIRGGGEYGRAWHEAAIKTGRQKAFDDFIAAARWLVSSGLSVPERIAARGNSNGGLLVATTALQAPEAFGAVFCRAPILDMLRFPSFGFLSSAVTEYGSPDDPVEGPYLASYSPYHNIRGDRAYPAMAIVSALNDRVAPPHDPLKMIARLQGEGAQGGPFLLLPLRSSGHAGGTTLSALIEQDVNELSFYCWALGAPLPGPGPRS